MAFYVADARETLLESVGMSGLWPPQVGMVLSDFQLAWAGRGAVLRPSESFSPFPLHPGP